MCVAWRWVCASALARQIKSRLHFISTLFGCHSKRAHAPYSASVTPREANMHSFCRPKRVPGCAKFRTHLAPGTSRLMNNALISIFEKYTQQHQSGLCAERSKSTAALTQTRRRRSYSAHTANWLRLRKMTSAPVASDRTPSYYGASRK